MMKLVKNLVVYAVLILICLEVLVRVFHLYNDMPDRFVDSDNINKWIPGQTGYAVYGNRAQNMAEYHINESGYNSYREFNPTEDKFELALIGDSYIEGFHQDYNRSIGKRIEEEFPDIEVYEYGHSANDLADQLYLVYKNEEHFDKIDKIIFYIKFENDLNRDEYKHTKHEPLFKSLRKSKLLEYAINIGVMDPVKEMVSEIRQIGKRKKNLKKADFPNDTELNRIRTENFDTLIERYGFDKEKCAILLDSRITPPSFVGHLADLDIDVIDFASTFEESGGSRRTTLIYDQHWNSFGRKLIADLIKDHIRNDVK